MDFEYTSLPADCASLRLLHLQPSSDHDSKVQCVLAHASLADEQSPKYEALSYTWGDPTQKVEIGLNGTPFLATGNLEAALRALREPDEPRTLWVDAVCINQSDVLEQGSQVKMMWEIYRHAERVLVWLGAEDGDSATAMADIGAQTTQKRAIKWMTTRREKPAHYDGTSWCDCNAGRWELYPPRVGLSNLLRRSWFTRVWVLQEVAAAKDILVCCGNQVVSGEDFHDEIDGVARQYPSFQKLLRGVRAAFELLDSSITTLEKQSTPLLELIETFRSRNASRPVDKVYALLSFSSDAHCESSLQPDYTIPEHLLARRIVQFGFPSCTLELPENSISNEVTFEVDGLILGTINGKWSGKDNMRSWTFQTKNHSKQEQPKNVTTNSRIIEYFKHQWQINVLGDRRLCLGDFVCLLRGASRPTILRYKDARYTVAMMATAPPTPRSNQLAIDQGSFTHTVRDLSVFLEERPSSPLLRTTWSDVVEVLSKESDGFEKFKLRWDPLHQATADEVKQFSTTPNDWQVQFEATQESFRDRAALARKAGEMEEIITCTELSMLHIMFSQDEEKIANGTSELTITVHKAAASGFLGALRVLLDAGAKVEELDDNGFTALHLAAACGHLEVVESLLKAKATPDVIHDVEWTPLHLAIGEHRDDICQVLLDYGARPDAQGDEMPPPLFTATVSGQSSVVRMLLKAGADSNAVHRVMGNVAALHIAAELGDIDIATMLLSEHARVDIATAEGLLALHQAAMNGHSEMVMLLLDAGSEINAVNDQGVTPLDFAVFKDHEQTAHIIRSRGGIHRFL